LRNEFEPKMMMCPVCKNSVEQGASFCGKCGQPLAVVADEAEAFPADESDSEPDQALADPLLGQVLDSKYELLELLGQGGMGAVYRAHRRHIGDEVAIKVLLEKYLSGKQATERFRREARAAAMLRHPNIVAIHDFSDGLQTDTPPYIVMELVEGTSLRTIVRDEGKIVPDRAVSLFRGICAGVAAAHHRGIIHRDLKPDNIIIAAPSRAGESETVKVIDFGIVKLFETDTPATLTQTGTLIGTPSYMSPEQCLGEALDARSDVYSLGAILYEILGGRPPFTGTTPTAVLARHLTDRAIPLAELGVAPAFGAVCERALAKVPEERYQTVDDLYADLFRALEEAKSAPVTSITAAGGAETEQQTLVAASQRPARELSTIVGYDCLAPTISAAAAPLVPEPPTQSTGHQIERRAALRVLSGREFRRIRRFAISGGVLLFLISLGVGFLVRWLGWTSQILSYDEFALLLITVAARDAVFGVSLGAALSGIRWPKPAAMVAGSEWPASLVRYASAGAALVMMPFVFLRTSLVLLPIGLAIAGIFIGLLACGIKLLIQKFVTSK
jgi:serine/threonine protein kinase